MVVYRSIAEIDSLAISHRVEVDVEVEATVAPNDDFLPNALKTRF